MPRATKRDVMRAERETGRVHELLGGVLIEKPPDALRGYLAGELILRLGRYLDESDIGFCVGPQATLALRRGVVVSPDVAFIPWNQCPSGMVPFEPAPNLVPALTADVTGPGAAAGRIARKLKEYFLAGVRVVWVIDPAKRSADVYTAPDSRRSLDESGTLDGGDVLPGFRLPLAKLFERLEKPKAKKPRKKR